METFIEGFLYVRCRMKNKILFLSLVINKSVLKYNLGGGYMATVGISVDVYDKINIILKNLYTCTDKTQIDDVFDKNGVDSLSERIALLRRCMNVECVYGTPETLTDKDDYEFECAVFVEGTWRMLN